MSGGGAFYKKPLPPNPPPQKFQRGWGLVPGFQPEANPHPLFLCRCFYKQPLFRFTSRPYGREVNRNKKLSFWDGGPGEILFFKKGFPRNLLFLPSPYLSNASLLICQTRSQVNSGVRQGKKVLLWYRGSEAISKGECFRASGHRAVPGRGEYSAR
jgi:hypothetical protein